MTIAVQCGGCGKRFKASDQHAGKNVKCPGCAASITIPAATTAPAAGSLGDLLDDELKVSAPAPAAAAKPAGRKCRQCGDELIEGSHYCMACGCNNRDVSAAVGATALAYDKRQQKLEAAARPRHWLVQWLFVGWFR
jgi:hypothetical protein